MTDNNWEKTRISYLNWFVKSDLRNIFSKRLKYKNYSLWWSTAFADRDIINDNAWYLNLHSILNNKNFFYSNKFIYSKLVVKLIKRFLSDIFFNIAIKFIFNERNNNKKINSECYFSVERALFKYKNYFIDRMYGSSNLNSKNSYLIHLDKNLDLIVKSGNIKKKLSKLPGNFFLLEKHINIKDILLIYFFTIYSFFKLIFILKKKNFFIIRNKDCSKILKPLLIESFFGNIQRSLLLGIATKNFLKKKKFSNFINYLEFYPNARAIYYFVKSEKNLPKVVSINHTVGFTQNRLFYSLDKREFSQNNNSLFYSPKPDIFFTIGDKYSKFLKLLLPYNKNIFAVGSSKNELTNLKAKKRLKTKKNTDRKDLLLIILGDGDYKDVVDILNKCNLEKLKIIVKINPYIPKVGKTDIISYFQKFFLFKFKELKSFSTREVIDFADIIITGGESSLSFEAVIRRKDLRIIRIFSGKYPPVSEKENAFFTIGNPKTLQKALTKKKIKKNSNLNKFTKDYFYLYDQRASKRYLKILEKLST